MKPRNSKQKSGILNRIKDWLSGTRNSDPPEPALIPRSEHQISRSNISENALKVLYRLDKAGYQACLVGGGVRDLLLGLEPKDFDVATNALPEQVKSEFRNCRLIGRRFRLAHVFFGPEIIEVATFRGTGDGDDEESDLRTQSDEGRILRDNVYGSIEEDAWRRDFTVNALYYDIRTFSVLDFTGGMADLRNGILRMIGDPELRYREDPVRMLRVVRFAAKLGFRIHEQTEAPIKECGVLLDAISSSRLFDESIKLFFSGKALQTFELLRHYNLFGRLYPQTEAALAQEEQGFPLVLVARAMANTDARVAEDKPVTPAFLYAAILWEPVRLLARELEQDEGMNEFLAIQTAGSTVTSQQAQRTSIPKRFSLPMKEIWSLQPRFVQRGGGRPFRLLTHPRFRAAYDFLVLRAECGEAPQELADWWTRFQHADSTEQNAMTRAVGGGKRKRKRRPRNRKPGQESAS